MEGIAMALFANSLFVSYGKGTPSDGRIPYTQGAALTGEVIDRLTAQIQSGYVRSVQLEDETRETSLEADFRDGWATVYIVRDCDQYYELVNGQCPTDETPLDITGDGPTPRKHATQDMGLMAEIVSCFARTGEVSPACAWEHTIH